MQTCYAVVLRTSLRLRSYSMNLNEEDQTFKFEKHVSATPVPSSVYGWNYNDEQYIAEH